MGRVKLRDDGRYIVYLATLSIRKNIELKLIQKTKDHEPGFVVVAGSDDKNELANLRNPNAWQSISAFSNCTLLFSAFHFVSNSWECKPFGGLKSQKLI